jgi:hypothetical protein
MGNTFLFPSMEDVEHFVMDPSIGGNKAPCVLVWFFSVDISDTPSSLFYNENACSSIPTFQVGRPIAVQPPGSHIADIQGSRTGPAYTLDMEDHPGESLEVLVSSCPDIVRESCGKETADQAIFPAHSDPCPIEVCTL